MISDARALALCSFEGPRERSLTVSGGHGEGETPLPIPNRAVKPLSADGTWLVRAWESRSPPVFSSGTVGRSVNSLRNKASDGRNGGRAKDRHDHRRAHE
jgi:hypothetical protein